MYWALNDDLLAAYTRRHSNPIVLSDGAMRRASGFLHLYDFGLLKPTLRLRAGQDVQGVFGTVHLACTVVEVAGLDICLALPRSGFKTDVA